MKNELHLGALTLVGEQAGGHIHVTVLGAGPPGQRPLCGRITVALHEWSSLQTLVEVLALADKRNAKDLAALVEAKAGIERGGELLKLAQQQLREHGALVERITQARAFFAEQAKCDDPVRRELATVVMNTLDRITEVDRGN